jgi:hypothetical protein
MRNLKEITKKMAEALPGQTMGYIGPEGYMRVAAKDGDDGARSGVFHAAQGIGARLARGGEVDQEEISLLIQRAGELKISDPDGFINQGIKHGKTLVEEE